ncbi:nucleoside-diphosphate sugar epimerase/dehydratase [Janthinobacterium sp. 17J80-10]|uniref:polysaccharide biosynthesis protein n=1 Tax=Janthinobacterium sp. 17J80-10 TaxID=2497863 RepID=UPI0010055428|nr:nucleoside-diphosphate sugar epimerase/dehydratase [Janthinobacterium sp. 17J80-10]QAU33552.1 polysaccharide biosynthesis protein [Janthinobacterium sp. 17J80-10]
MKAFLDLPRFYKKLIAVAADLVFLPLAFYLAIVMRYEGVTMALFQQYFLLVLAAPAFAIPIFIRMGLYRAVVRYVDYKIVYVVIAGVSLAVIIMAALATLTHQVGLSRGVLGIYWVSAILYVVASRFLARSYFLHASSAGTERPRVAIYGAGQGGTQLLGALRAGEAYLPVAFIDDKAELKGTTIAGIKVFPSTQLAAMVARKKIDGVVLAMPSLTKAQQRHIIDRLEPLKLKTWVMPPVENLMSGASKLDDVREIDIEDLLGRDPVAPDPALISRCITGKTVLVSGAGGSIGSELCRQILRLRPKRLLLLEMSEFSLYSIEQELQALQRNLQLEIEVLPFLGSVLEQDKCERMMRSFEVETIYHAAAYKHVPLVEHNPIDGIRNNSLGTLHFARAAMAAGVKCFVLISTDKAVRPTNVMGSTKRLAELIMQAFARQQKGTRFCMVRFGNVLGSSGSVVPLFRKQILAGGPITLTHPEITRYFMTIPEAAQLVLQAGSMGEGGDVFVLDMGEPVKIADMARRMVHLSGLEVKSEETPEGSIEIRHVGLRPGEKLYEELLIGSNVEGTEHPLIMRAQEAEIPWPLLQEFLGKLDAACARYDHEEVRALLLRIVPGYVPQCGIEDLIWRIGRQAQRRDEARLR